MSSIAPAAELCGSAALKKLLSVTDERRKESDNNRTASVSDSLDSGKDVYKRQELDMQE